MSIKNLLTDEIGDQLSEIHKLEVGSENSKIAINGVGMLVDKVNDIEKLELERQKLEMENENMEIERERVENEKRDRNIKNKITIGTAAAGAGITIGMGLLAYVYEERGTITSKAGKRFTDRAFDYFFRK